MKRLATWLVPAAAIALGAMLWLQGPLSFDKGSALSSFRTNTAQATEIAADRLPPGHFGQLIIKDTKGKSLLLSNRKINVRVKVKGRIARTEVEQVFYNHTSRQTEGTFTFRLPHGASITRLAMQINGKLVEGELVERTRARAIYNSIVRRMKDPALLEWQGGNRFRTQIFPIPARGTKRIILGYDTVLHGPPGYVDYNYLLPNKKQPITGHFSLTIDAHGNPKAKVMPYDATIKRSKQTLTIQYKAKHFRPRGHLSVRFQYKRARGLMLAGTVDKKKFGLVEIPVQIKGHTSTYKHRMLLLDTSAGMKTKGLQKAVDIAQVLLEGLPKDARFGVWMGDLTARAFRPRAVKKGVMFTSKSLAEALDVMRAQRPRGATHLERLFLAAIRSAQANTELFYIGDGHATVGQMDPGKLITQVKQAIGTRHIRISAIAIGPNPDLGFLRKLSRATGGRLHRLHIGQSPKAAVAALTKQLNVPQLTDIKYTVKGMKNIVRADDNNVSSGDTLLLAGELTAPAVEVNISGKIDREAAYTFKQVYEPQTDKDKEIVPAFWARFTLDRMQKKTDRKSRQKIVKLSKVYGVMSRYTSFLVLENEQAYKKHNIARRKKKANKRVFHAKKPAANKGTLSKKEAKQAIRRWMGRPGEADAEAPQGNDSARRDGFRQQDEGGRARTGSGGMRFKAKRRTRRRYRREIAPAPTTATPPSPGSGADVPRVKRVAAAPAKRRAPKMLIPHARTFKIRIKSKPAGAKVYMGRRLMGRTPLVLTLRKGQRVKLRIVKTCYKTRTLRLTVTRPRTLTLSLSKDKSNRRCRRGASLDIRSDKKACGKKKDLHKKRRRVSSKNNRLRAAYKAVKAAPMNWQRREQLYRLLMNTKRHKQALSVLRDWRRYAPEDIQLIARESKLLRTLGMFAEAKRVLSEIVEFSPQDYGNRIQYATHLEKQGNVSGACQELTQAVRLNPARRNTFKQMMSLYRRRKHSEFKQVIRRCITKGVSQLPVERDISVVMFWDDPSADIDLHIYEPDGSHVSYRKRESRQGGTLYYDITNGFGPEIYVLGTAKKGAYTFKVVYYRGAPQKLTGKVIIMRNAGSPKETREVHKFVLYKKYGKKPQHIKTFTLK